jgi:hypothetical protein
MATEKLSKFDVASKQLETAIGLFVSGRDPLSAITLAGAADTILSALVLRAKKEPFADLARKMHEGVTPSRSKFSTFMNDLLRINAIKHMDENDSDDVEIDVRECAIGAIGKAAANYRLLVPGESPQFIKAYFAWTWQNLDHSKYFPADPADGGDG